MIGFKYIGLALVGVLAVAAVIYGVLKTVGRGGEAEEDGTWVNGEGTVNDRPAIYRADSGLFDLPNSTDYAYEVIVSVKMRAPDERGFPKEEELNRLYDFEDAVVPLVEANGWGHLAVVLTTDGFRDFIFYVKDDKSVPGRLRPLEGAFQDLQVEVRGKHDPDWKQLKRFGR